MQLICQIPTKPLFPNGCVLTIGNFDGVHLGHQALLKQLQSRARQLQLPLVIMIFEPQPLEYFRGVEAPARLTRLREKLLAMQDFDIDTVIVIPFNRAFSDITADQFISDILAILHVKLLMVGHDFRFGHGRAGDYNQLVAAAPTVGFTLEQMQPVSDANGERISSTLIRTALANGEFERAAQWLGRPYRWVGRVIHGDQRGRTLGFPTANLRPQRRVSPLQGVFAVKIRWKGQNFEGIANLGKRPTLDGLQFLLEVHIFEFHHNIYGDKLEIQFEHKLRSERKFSSIDDLRHQITLDQKHARDFFAAKRIVS